MSSKFMRKVWVAGLILGAVTLGLTLSDFEVGKFEVGKYDTFEEALEKGIPYKVKEVIHTQKIDGVTVVMYLTEPGKEILPPVDDVPAIAFLEGNNNDGWENIGPNGWTHYENDNMTVYFAILHDHDPQGNPKHEIFVVFGEINNPQITKIETKTQQEESFEPAKIIQTDHGRYYFQVGREVIVRGLIKDGKVIDQQGG